MADLFAPLSREQLQLLSTIADPYLQDGRWPIWHYVESKLDRIGLDAKSIIRSLPMVGSQTSVGPSYGLAWYNRNHIGEEDQPALTVAAALHLPELASIFGAPFIRVLNVLVEMQLNAPSSPHEVSRIKVTPETIRQALPSISDSLLIRLPGIFEHEPPTMGGSHSHQVNNPTVWERELRREVLKYKGVVHLRGYVERVTKLLSPPVDAAPDAAHLAALSFPAPPLTSVTPAPTPTPAPPVFYVATELIDELKQKSGTATWNLDKLLQLIHELNHNFGAGNPYACHALLRAILDHTPPVFGFKTFDQVVNNYAWSQTDKKYMKKLGELRNSADDVLHRQIRESASLISMDDLPSRAAVNAFLRGCADAL